MFDPEDEATPFFKTAGATCTTTHCHIQEDMNILS
jgi:hypothetical protein